MLLSESELRAALEPVLNRVLADRLRLFQLQFEPRLQSLLQATLRDGSAQVPLAALDRLLEARDPNAAFGAFFELARELTGPVLALQVIHRGQATTWRSLGITSLPLLPRLDGSDRIAIIVRGVAVGLLVWENSTGLDAAALGKLRSFGHLLGTVLLQLALPAPKPIADIPAAASLLPASAPSPSAPGGASPAENFAQLLIEDLALYLHLERGAELASARRAGEVGARFADELTRCRRAFTERFGSGDNAVVEQAIQRVLG